MKSILAIVLLCACPAAAQITYLDATTENTAAYDPISYAGNDWLAVGGGSGDHRWDESAFANSGTVFASNDEDSPVLVTTIAGLTPNALHAVYAYFWATTTGGNGWRLKASLDAADLDDNGTPGNPGDDFLRHALSVSFAQAGITGTTPAPAASAADFATPVPLLIEGPRVLYQANLGQLQADGNGQIRVLIDDFSPAGADTPTWFDGVGYEKIADPMPRPNVIVILSDDQGWADIGYNNPNVYTPNLDALAANGATLAQHYSMSQCTPSRVAVMTGRYPSRWGRQAQQANNEQAFPHEILTMAGMLDDMGYESHLSGKWHMGSPPESGPLHHGFDTAHGALTGAVGMYDHRYRPGNIWEITWHRNHEIIPGYENGTHVTDLTAREATRFIQEQRDVPFFLYLPFHAPHTPLDERGPYVNTPTQLDPADSTRWLNEDNIPWFNDPLGKIQAEPDPEKRLLLATVHHLDDAVGQVVRALEETGQRENTIIFFSSDNGPQVNWNGNAYPDDLNLTNFNQPDSLRGSKTDVYEGGIHVPGFINWPARITPRVVTEPVHVLDWMPTLAALTAYQPADHPQWDGEDLSPLLFGNGTLGTRTFYWLWNSNSNRWAVRQGDWKIVRYGAEPTVSTEWQLFNLATDPGESTNLASSNPLKRDEMHQVFLAQRAKDFTGNMVNPRLTASSSVTGTFTVNVTFTASVTGLELGDFEVTNGTASLLSGAGSTYIVEITPNPTANDAITIRLPAGAAAGTAAPSAPSNTLEVELDTTGTLPITPFNRGVAGQESAGGPGYILYSRESVHSRFAATAPHMYNADHFIAVRHTGTAWQYDTNVAYANFTPDPNDVLVASVDFSANTLTMLAGTDTTINGIAAGYQSGNFTVLPNRWNGGSNSNEFDLTGSDILLNDGTELGTPPAAGLSVELFSPWATSATPFIIDVIFSEPVTGLEPGDFTVTNGTATALTGSAASYQLSVTPNSPGIITVDLAADAVNEGTLPAIGSITHWNDYHLWANSLFAHANDPTHRSRTGDADGDARTNFEEFVFGGIPTRFDASPPSSIVVTPPSGQAIAFEVPLRDLFTAGAANYQVEYTNDLLRWFLPSQDLTGIPNPPPAISIAPPAITPFSTDPVWGDLSLHSYAVSPTIPGANLGSLFFRVSAPPPTNQ